MPYWASLDVSLSKALYAYLLVVWYVVNPRGAITTASGSTNDGKLSRKKVGSLHCGGRRARDYRTSNERSYFDLVNRICVNR